MTAYMRWLEAERDLDFDGDYDRLWDWSVADVAAFWRSIWDYFDVAADGDSSTALASADMPGAEWFPGTSLNYAEHIFRGKDPTQLAIQHAGGGRAPRRDHLGRALRARRGLRRRPPLPGRRARRPRRRLPPERPRSARRLPRLRLHRRDLVVLLARLRRPLGHRPLRPDRAQGPPRRRRLHLRRQALRPHGHRRGPRSRDALPRPHRPRPLPRPGRRPVLASRTASPGATSPPRAPARPSSSSASPSTTPCGSSTPRAPPACPRRSSRDTAASSSST